MERKKTLHAKNTRVGIGETSPTQQEIEVDVKSFEFEILAYRLQGFRKQKKKKNISKNQIYFNQTHFFFVFLN